MCNHFFQKNGSNGLSLRGSDILIFGTEMNKKYILKWLIHSHNDEIAEYTYIHVITQNITFIPYRMSANLLLKHNLNQPSEPFRVSNMHGEDPQQLNIITWLFMGESSK